MEEVFGTNTLDWIYALFLLISFIFAIVALIGADDGLDLDMDADTGIDAISISPFALAMFGATFGLVGLITRRALEMAPIPSIITAAVAGLLIGAAGQAVFLYVFSPSKSSHFSLSNDAVGREVEVIISIPEDGLGTIAFDNISGRVTMGARSSTGQSIHKGEAVIVEKVTGRVALVRPLSETAT